MVTKTRATKRIADNGKATKESTTEPCVIEELKFIFATFTIRGDAPMVQNRFSQKALRIMEDAQREGAKAKNKKTREPKDFEELFRLASHRIDGGQYKGRYGIPANGLRAAMIRACKLAGFDMTTARCTVFVEADGKGDDGTPLVVIDCEEPEQTIMAAPNSGPGRKMDLRSRPMFAKGWTADVTIKFDSDQFSTTSIANLLHRAGQQVGICEGRPMSRQGGPGMGWGTFVVLPTAE